MDIWISLSPSDSVCVNGNAMTMLRNHLVKRVSHISQHNHEIEQTKHDN